MTYAIVSSGAIERCGSLPELFPDTSFPLEGPSQAFMETYGLHQVQSSLPFDGKSQKLIEVAPYILDGGVYGVAVVDLSQEELAALDRQQAERVRSERDQRLSRCDWTQIPDAFSTGVDQAAWALYRQELRDLSKQDGFPWSVIWPSEPTLPEQAVICDYRAFYDALLVSPAYAVIRAKAVQNSAVLTACVEFIAAIGDAKAGRPNPPAIQACVDLLCAAAQFTTAELVLLGEAMAVGQLDQVYVLPPQGL